MCLTTFRNVFVRISKNDSISKIESNIYNDQIVNNFFSESGIMYAVKVKEGKFFVLIKPEYEKVFSKYFNWELDDTGWIFVLD